MINMIKMIRKVRHENDELTEKIIGCAYKVYNIMGFGYLAQQAPVLNPRWQGRLPPAARFNAFNVFNR
jgi:hypothetical protein